MKAIFKTFIFVFLLSALSSQAQILVRNNFYVQNPYLINPALTGFHGEVTAYLNYRDQWQGLSGAPEVGQLGVHGPISEHMGLGAKASILSSGIFRETMVDLTWAYWMNVHEGATLSVGASMGFAFSKIKIEQVRTRKLVF